MSDERKGVGPAGTSAKSGDGLASPSAGSLSIDAVDDASIALPESMRVIVAWSG